MLALPSPCLAHTQGASVRHQTRALFAKSAVYQRRNTATNVCLVVAPIFFCVLLAALQVLAGLGFRGAAGACWRLPAGAAGLGSGNMGLQVGVKYGLLTV